LVPELRLPGPLREYLNQHIRLERSGPCAKNSRFASHGISTTANDAEIDENLTPNTDQSLVVAAVNSVESSKPAIPTSQSGQANTKSKMASVSSSEGIVKTALLAGVLALV